MKPFTLHAALNYRQQLEDTAATELGKAQRHLHQQQVLLRDAEEKYRSLLATMEDLQTEGVSIEELLRFENRLQWLKEQRVKLAKDVETAEHTVERKRYLVISRSRDKKVLEQLKARQDSAWQRYLQKKEMAQLDEIAVLSYSQKQRNSQ